MSRMDKEHLNSKLKLLQEVDFHSIKDLQWVHHNKDQQ